MNAVMFCFVFCLVFRSYVEAILTMNALLCYCFCLCPCTLFKEQMLLFVFSLLFRFHVKVIQSLNAFVIFLVLFVCLCVCVCSFVLFSYGFFPLVC